MVTAIDECPRWRGRFLGLRRRRQGDWRYASELYAAALGDSAPMAPSLSDQMEGPTSAARRGFLREDADDRVVAVQGFLR